MTPLSAEGYDALLKTAPPFPREGGERLHGGGHEEALIEALHTHAKPGKDNR